MINCSIHGWYIAAQYRWRIAALILLAFIIVIHRPVFAGPTKTAESANIIMVQAFSMLVCDDDQMALIRPILDYETFLTRADMSEQEGWTAQKRLEEMWQAALPAITDYLAIHGADISDIKASIQNRPDLFALKSRVAAKARQRCLKAWLPSQSKTIEHAVAAILFRLLPDL